MLFLIEFFWLFCSSDSLKTVGGIGVFVVLLSAYCKKIDNRGKLGLSLATETIEVRKIALVDDIINGVLTEEKRSPSVKSIKQVSEAG